MIKSYLNFLLSRNPKLYETVLQFRKNFILEKVIFINLIQNSDIVLDIGANKGYYTLLFSHLVGSRGEIHAFEPVLSTFEVLTKFISKHQKFDNIYLSNVGIANYNGKAIISIPDDDDGQASLKTHNYGSWKEPKRISNYEIDLITLDSYKIFNKLNFIKCDVEGAELLVLEGARETIMKHHPIISLEISWEWTKDFGYNPINILQILSDFGYQQFYLFNTYLKLLESPHTYFSQVKFTGSVNLLCVIPNLHNSRIRKILKYVKFD